jgi:hypothetical protein
MQSDDETTLKLKGADARVDIGRGSFTKYFDKSSPCCLLLTMQSGPPIAVVAPKVSIWCPSTCVNDNVATAVCLKRRNSPGARLLIEVSRERTEFSDPYLAMSGQNVFINYRHFHWMLKI